MMQTRCIQLAPFVCCLLFAVVQPVSAAESVCDIALKSNSLNTSEFSQTSRILMKKKDESCKSEYNSAQEAVSAGQAAGGTLGYGGFSIGLSEAKQSTSGKYTIADSKFCRATAEEIDSLSTTTARQQVADIALAAWSDCVSKVETNKLYVRYSPNSDGTGTTAHLVRTLRSGSIGKIIGIAASPAGKGTSSLACSFGTQAVAIDKKIEIQIDKAETAFACSKEADKSLKISILTSEGDQEWITLPSATELKQLSVVQVGDSIEALRRQQARTAQMISQAEISRSADLARTQAVISAQQATIQSLQLQLSRQEAALTQDRAALRYTVVKHNDPCPPGWQNRGPLAWQMIDDANYSANTFLPAGVARDGWRWTHPLLCSR